MRRFCLTCGILITLAALPLHAQDEGASEGVEAPGIKVAVITHAGGAHLSAYFNGLAHSPEAASVVLADPQGTAAEMARKILGDKLTAIHQDRDRLLAEEKPDMALVSMEALLAPEAITAALEAGCHVLSEKPASVNAADFEALVTLAESKERHLMLALTNRVNDEVVKAKELIAAGALGDLYGVQLSFVKDQSRLRSKSHQASWYADKERAGGGQLIWLGIHWLDLAMFVTDSAITEVAGFAENVGGQPVNIEDAVALSMRFDNGALGTMTSAYFLDQGLHSLLKVWGSQGWLEITSDAPRVVRWYTTVSGEPVSDSFESPGGPGNYTTFVQAAVRASAGLEAPPITGRESLRVLKVIYGTYDAAEQGKSVKVN